LRLLEEESWARAGKNPELIIFGKLEHQEAGILKSFKKRSSQKIGYRG